MLLKLRRDLVQQHDPTSASFLWRAGMRAWRIGMKSPLLYRIGAKAASIGSRLIARNGKITKLPFIFGGWTKSRDFKAFPKETFRERYAKRKRT
jgi:L-lactate dehydrogenase complex protein LldF